MRMDMPAEEAELTAAAPPGLLGDARALRMHELKMKKKVCPSFSCMVALPSACPICTGVDSTPNALPCRKGWQAGAHGFYFILTIAKVDIWRAGHFTAAYTGGKGILVDQPDTFSDVFGCQERASPLLHDVVSVLRSRGVAHQPLAPTSDGLFWVDIALPGARSQRHAVMMHVFYDMAA